MNAPTPATKSDIWPERPNAKIERLLADTGMVRLFEERPAALMRAFQMERLSHLLTYLRAVSPFWKERLKHLKAGTALADLPTLDRAGFRAFHEAQETPIPLPEGHGRLVPNSTSGSSGTPVIFNSTELHQRIIAAHNFADVLRYKRDTDAPIIAILNGIPDHPGEFVERRDPPILGTGLRIVRKRPLFTLEQHAEFLSRTPAAYMLSSPAFLDGVSDSFEAGHFPTPRFREVMTLGETVTPDRRERTRALYGARICDTFSCEEVGQIAHQCPTLDDFYHVAGTNVIVEIVGEDDTPCPAGTVGRVLLTGLHNWASPVVRYDIGDMAAMLPACPCGHPQPALTHLLGRRINLVRLPSGSRQLVFVAARYWAAIAPFRESRLIQRTADTIIAEIVMDRPISDGERSALLALLRERISPEFVYRIDQVERIEWTASHKRQSFVSFI